MKKRVLFDTNVILDFFLGRNPFFVEAVKALDAVSKGKVVGLVSAHAVTTIFYILAREVGLKKARQGMTGLLEKIVVAPVTETIIHQALVSSFNDFEDAVTYYAALTANAEFIVTRNIKDFTEEQLPAILPQVFNASLQPLDH